MRNTLRRASTATATVFIVLAVGVQATGCAKDCVEACTEAQAGDCTSITGDCGEFCDALDNVEGPSGCGSQRESYMDCLNDASAVCDVDCDAEESSLSTCVGLWCVSHATDPDCQTLVASF